MNYSLSSRIQIIKNLASTSDCIIHGFNPEINLISYKKIINSKLFFTFDIFYSSMTVSTSMFDRKKLSKKILFKKCKFSLLSKFFINPQSFFNK